MDPVTIMSSIAAFGQLAKYAWDIGEGLHVFISQTKVVDATARNLAAEVRGLGDACDTVNRQVQGLIEAYGGSNVEEAVQFHDDSSFWKCFNTQVVDCERTIGHLSKAIESSTQGGTSVASRTLRQIKLNMNAAEIGSTRERIRSHTASLQMILLAANMYELHGVLKRSVY